MAESFIGNDGLPQKCHILTLRADGTNYGFVRVRISLGITTLVPPCSSSHGAFLDRLTALLASLLGTLVSFAPPAAAATYRSFTPPRYQTNDNGAIEMIGNHNQTCQPGSSVGSGASQITCAALLASNALGHNATLPMVQLDADTSATTTINSSSADLNLPAGSTVLFAGLYWSGTAANNAVDRNKVQFLGPGDATYTQVVATQLDIDNPAAVGANQTFYQGFLDVTAAVTAKGNGTYWVGDVKSSANSNTYAAWSMVIVLQNSIYPVRSLSVFEGFGKVASSAGDQVLDIPIGPFLTPPNGTVNASVGFVAWEGDATLVGDKALFKNGTATAATPNSAFTTLSDAVNLPNDFFNSSISKNGVNVSARYPNDVNNLGVDIDQLAIPGLLPNGATDATVRLTSAGDTILPSIIAVTVDLYTPSFSAITKTAVDLNSGTTVPGDIIEYSITMNNTGLDPAIKVSARIDPSAPAGTLSNTALVAGAPCVTGGCVDHKDWPNRCCCTWFGRCVEHRGGQRWALGRPRRRGDRCLANGPTPRLHRQHHEWHVHDFCRNTDVHA